MPTTASLPLRLLLCLLVAVTLTTAAFAATATAAANPVQIPTTTSPPNTGPNTDPQPCTGLFNGTTGTDTVTEGGHMVSNADGTFHEFLYVSQDIREDWADGTYLTTVIKGPLDFNVNATGTSSFSGTQQGPGTLYSSTGQILAYVTINTQFHGTFVDGVAVPASLTNHFIIVRDTCA
jgi:hypothetical protein